jgi:hypothetical protein
MYDQRLMELLKQFRRAFHETVRHGEYYHPTVNHTAYIFTNPGDMPLTGDKEEIWNTMSQAVDEMRTLFSELLAVVRSGYVEVDLEETSNSAWKLYRSHQEELPDKEVE